MFTYFPYTASLQMHEIQFDLHYIHLIYKYLHFTYINALIQKGQTYNKLKFILFFFLSLDYSVAFTLNLNNVAFIFI